MEPPLSSHDERGERAHVYLGPLPGCREASPAHRECPSCERPSQRAEGLAGGLRFRSVVREIAIALARVGRGESYRRVSRQMRSMLKRTSSRGATAGRTSRQPHVAINYLDAFAGTVIDALAPTEWPPVAARPAWSA